APGKPLDRIDHGHSGGHLRRVSSELALTNQREWKTKRRREVERKRGREERVDLIARWRKQRLAQDEEPVRRQHRRSRTSRVVEIAQNARRLRPAEPHRVCPDADRAIPGPQSGSSNEPGAVSLDLLLAPLHGSPCRLALRRHDSKRPA